MKNLIINILNGIVHHGSWNPLLSIWYDLITKAFIPPTANFQNGIRTTLMTLGALLIAYLASLYLLAMLFLWRSLRRQKTELTPSMEVRFALREGQTIVGVGDTTQGIDFYIGDYVRDEHYYDL